MFYRSLPPRHRHAWIFRKICWIWMLIGLDILAKVALNEGMSSYVFVALYRHDASALVVMILALLEPVIGQNLYILGMRATTATFTVSMSNVLPAITFVIAWILRLEVVNLKSIRSQAKVAGTLTTVAGAMIMTLVKGPLLELFWTKGRTNKKEEMHNGVDLQLSLKGAIMIVIGCFGWSCFVILQAITLKSYPDELAMTAWIWLLATIEGAIATLIMERGNPAVWAIICSPGF
ncbi:hypothetical protein HanPI659440_Chr11g0436991 [Helianthus annuus]|nr:hypothetical protein HanPI659440_Chr11g0436991 [Helianthus annuus]